jgi:hypothetical protein
MASVRALTTLGHLVPTVRSEARIRSSGMPVSRATSLTISSAWLRPPILRSAWMAALVLAQLSSYSYQRVRWTSLGGSGGTSARITFLGRTGGL